MSRRNIIDRAKLRGKPLLDMCKNRPDIISRNECGENDNRQFCRGFVDMMTDDYLPECRNCGA